MCTKTYDGNYFGHRSERSNRKGRPNYPVEFKRRLAAAACEAGKSVSKLTMAKALNANMLFKWRCELRAGLFDDAPLAMTKILPVVLAAAPAEAESDASSAPSSSGTASAAIEIVIADAVARIHGSPDAVMLMTIFQSLRT